MSSSAISEAPGAVAWRTAAYGLALEGDFPVTGLDDGVPSTSAGDLPAVALRRSTRQRLRAVWPESGAERISAVRGANGRPALTILRHPEAGHLLTGVGYGSYHVDADAQVIRCAPVRAPEWRWRRYLLGQVLPFVAGLRGRELLHAGAVVVDGRALVVAGPSGAGKTTLVAHLVQAGADFFADDTVALEARGDDVIAHPGPALAVLRRDVADDVTADLGTPVGGDQDELAVAMRRIPDPVPLGAIAFLERGEHGRRPRIERLAPEDPRPLLGSTYDLVRRDPNRLRAQLDLVAHVARTATLLRVRIGLGTTPHELAEALAEAARP
jgi:hypothetical protein